MISCTQEEFNSMVIEKADLSQIRFNKAKGKAERYFFANKKVMGYIEGPFEKFYIKDWLLES